MSQEYPYQRVICDPAFQYELQRRLVGEYVCGRANLVASFQENHSEEPITVVSTLFPYLIRCCVTATSYHAALPRPSEAILR
jgi:hypothetical protein